ncbi:MAG: MarR family transcriptional regulator [Halobacteriaceae archaeon]
MQQMGRQRSRSDLDTGIIADDLASPRAKLVYLYLTTARGGSVDELHDSLGLSRLDLLGILGSLAKAGHVERDGERYYVA